jgi:hypothetical protein
MSMALGLEAANDEQGIELLWERIPANELEAPATAIAEIDTRAYSLDVFEVEDMMASAGPDQSADTSDCAAAATFLLCSSPCHE